MNVLFLSRLLIGLLYFAVDQASEERIFAREAFVVGASGHGVVYRLLKEAVVRVLEPVIFEDAVFSSLSDRLNFNLVFEFHQCIYFDLDGVALGLETERLFA